MTHPQPTNNGKWLVLGLLTLGVVLALIGLKYRRSPEATRPGAPPPPATKPSPQPEP